VTSVNVRINQWESFPAVMLLCMHHRWQRRDLSTFVNLISIQQSQLWRCYCSSVSSWSRSNR